MKKKMLALFLVLAMALCLFPASAFAAGTPVDPPPNLGTNQTFFYNKYGNYYIVNKNTLVSYGSKWGYVTCVQDLMNRFYECTGNEAYYVGEVDSDFGTKTRSAVMTFQANQGISCDGIVGPGTWTVFNTRWQYDLTSTQKKLPHVG